MGTIRNCDFFDCGGLAQNDSQAPLLTGDGNIVWPRGWTKEMARQWRLDNSARVAASFQPIEGPPTYLWQAVWQQIKRNWS